jgi:SAM-dependent methyltransferase
MNRLRLLARNQFRLAAARTNLSMRRRARALVASCPRPTDAAGDPQLREIPNDLWCWLNTVGWQSEAAIRDWLPPQADAATQHRTTGRVGAGTLLQACDAYLLFRELCERHAGAIDSVRICDFGAGWGRIARMFLRDVPKSGLTMFEPSSSLAGLAAAALPYPVVQTPFEPPTPAPAALFDFIYSFSVFSHLGERSHLAWIEEFSRLLRPGGLLVVTTRDRATIRLGHTPHPHVRRDREHFLDRTAEYLARYDRGELCHSTHRDRDPRQSDWGETCIPRGYVERHWSQFELLEYLAGQQVNLPQNVIVARRRVPVP